MLIQFLMQNEQTLQGIQSCELCSVADVVLTKGQGTVKITARSGKCFHQRITDFQQLNKVLIFGNKAKYYSLIDNPIQEVLLTPELKSSIENDIEELEDLIDTVQLEELEKEEEEENA